MTRNPVVWFEIYVTDMARARRFYEGVLAITLTELNSPAADIESMWAFPTAQDAAGATGALARMKGQQPSGTGTIVYFACNDCAVEARRVPSHGGTIVKDKFAIGQYGFIALVTDPEGNMVGLHSMQ